MTVSVTALDQNGAALGTAQTSLPPLGHRSFTLGQLLPALPANFLGSVVIASTTPAWQFLGWTANEDSGMLSTLPSGRAEWPISHWDRIWLVFGRVLDAARQMYPDVNFNGAAKLATGPVQLSIPLQWMNPTTNRPAFNATSSRAGVVTIPQSTSELISDSPSEIAWIVAHELGHQIQFRRGTLLYDNNIESDADTIGLILSLEAGFDPYAAAGALGKLAMATGTAGLAAQSLQDYEVLIGADPHLSWGDRINNLWNLLNFVCSSSAGATPCAQYKSLIHPDFPPYTPLFRPGRETVNQDPPIRR